RLLRYLPTLTLSILIPLPLSSTLFPYTTLFRSYASPLGRAQTTAKYISEQTNLPIQTLDWTRELQGWGSSLPNGEKVASWDYPRSEEHTSELQSRFDLVCRLLLEKKNKNIEDMQ